MARQEVNVHWDVPVELAADEQRVAARLRRIGKFYLFLRQVRHELFSIEFEAQLEQAYGKARGTAPLPAAMLATVTLLQAYDQVGDAEAVEAAVLDRRWQLVLGCLGAEEAPFSQGVLSQFRQRMIEHDLDRLLLDRTVELAKRHGTFGWKNLKAVLDSSPLLGAGRVEDTWNLIGRALSTVVSCAAKALHVPREQVLAEAQLTLLGASSLKAALDLDWDDDAQRAAALARLLGEVDALEQWVAQHAAALGDDLPLREALTQLRRVLAQDLEPDPTTGGRRIRRGTAPGRMPSLGDPEMRHGRKSKKKVFTGYKRHFIKSVTGDVILGALVLPANEAEQSALAPLLQDAERHGAVDEVHMDRGYLGSPTVPSLREQGTAICCKPWPCRNGDRFTKEDFAIDLRARAVTCPAGVSASLAPGALVARFPTETCSACSLRTACTTASGRGRSITIHPQEALLIELRAARRTAAGRQRLRARTTIEHTLAHLGRVQGPRARYRGARKNTLDARRCAVVVNLQTLARTTAMAAAA
jgi:hypothetical protein